MDKDIINKTLQNKRPSFQKWVTNRLGDFFWITMNLVMNKGQLYNVKRAKVTKRFEMFGVRA
jgi:hypothetical protein